MDSDGFLTMHKENFSTEGQYTEDSDFKVYHKDCSGMIRCSTSMTVRAKPNSEFEVHAHYNEFEIYHFLSGDLSFAFEGKRIAVKEGDMIIIANGLIHRPIINKTCRYYRKHILFNKDIFKRLSTTDFEFYHALYKRKILVLDCQTVEAEGFSRMYGEIENYIIAQTPYDDFCAMISLFSFLIKALKYSKDLIGTDFHVNSEKALAIIKYIDEHLSEELSYTVIAEQFYLSQKSLYKFFKKETGFTLSDYINERRIIIAQSLMNAGVSATDAASEAGYKDYSVFYRNFVKRVGVPPTKYMKD